MSYLDCLDCLTLDSTNKVQDLVMKNNLKLSKE